MNISELSMSEVLTLLQDENIDPRLLDQLAGLFYPSDHEIATHPKVLPETLEKLSDSMNAETVRRIVRNPATPPDLLIRLAPRFPIDFFQNAMLDLMVLEDPNLLKKLKPGVLRTFLKAEECPSSFVVWASRFGTKGDQLEIVRSEEASLDVLRSVANGAHPKPAERAIDRLLELGETW